jgi:hypothetical protein
VQNLETESIVGTTIFLGTIIIFGRTKINFLQTKNSILGATFNSWITKMSFENYLSGGKMANL